MAQMNVTALATKGLTPEKIMKSLNLNDTMAAIRVTKYPMWMKKTIDAAQKEFDFAGIILGDNNYDKSITTLSTANQVDSNEYWYVPGFEMQITKNDGSVTTAVELAALAQYVDASVLTVKSNSDNVQFEVPLSSILGNALNLVGDGTTVASNISMSIAKGCYTFEETPLEYGSQERFNFAVKTYLATIPAALDGVFDIKLSAIDRIKVSAIK